MKKHNVVQDGHNDVYWWVANLENRQCVADTGMIIPPSNWFLTMVSHNRIVSNHLLNVMIIQVMVNDQWKPP